MDSLLLNFPEGYEPREKQIDALKKIEEAFDDGHKFVIVHADTGIGKSHLSKTLGNYSKEPPAMFKYAVDDYSIFGEDGAECMPEESFGAYALTITKSLQDQYQNTFNNTGLLKGQSNYQCDVDDSLSVDVAPCIYVPTLKKECWGSCRCPYYNARNEMLKSQFSALNYSMFFSLPEHLRKRQIMICDEGSELEEQLVSQFTCEVDISFLMKTNTPVTPFPSSETPEKVKEWLSKTNAAITKSIDNYKEWFKDASNKKDHLNFSKKKGEYQKLNNLNTSVATLIATYLESQYIIEHLEKAIKFIPLKVDVLSKYLFDYADKVVILSATIIDPKAYCEALGIKEFKYIHVETDFDPKKSPIYIMAKQKLNFKNMPSMLPKLMDQISGILEEHKNDKGLIHTHTQYNADYIRNKIKNDRLLFREAGVNNEMILEEHENSSEPTVMVSPSMTYGVDLNGDLGRFQIIIKAPWLPTKDVRVEKLMKLDKAWYGDMMLKTLLQASGRITRSKDDWGTTYILDGSIFDVIQRNKGKLPKFFIERMQ